MEEIALELNDTAKIADTYSRLSAFYTRYDMKDLALEAYWKELAFIRSTRDSVLMKRHYGWVGWHIANLTYGLNDPVLNDSSISINRKAHSFFTPNNMSGYGERCFMTPLALARAGNREESLMCCHETLRNQWKNQKMRRRIFALMIEQFMALEMQDSTFMYCDSLFLNTKMYENLEGKNPYKGRNGEETTISNITLLIRAYIHFDMPKKAADLIDAYLYNDQPYPKTKDVIIYFQSLGIKAYSGSNQTAKAFQCQTAVKSYSDSIQAVEDEKTSQRFKQFRETSIFPPLPRDCISWFKLIG
ncbi:MAG: hypothetical protein MK105_17885 [Crocinitomicaceae bacterium]|nr:hypothetical protein [Crocinitomicaceae bacterium]